MNDGQSIHDLIRALRELPIELNPPVASDALRRMQKVVPGTLTADLLALYRDHDGMDLQDHPLPMRPLPAVEVIDFLANASDPGTGERPWLDRNVGLFWTDDNSNYAGVYLDGPLRGHVCILDHDEIDLSPRFRSISTFLRALIQGAHEGIIWFDLPFELPMAFPHDDPAVEQTDWNIAQQIDELLQTERDGDARHDYACSVMALTPFDQTESLMRFVWDKNMWIQQRCCEILGARAWKPAIDTLAQVAENCRGNGQSAAIMALGEIGTAKCLAHLQRLVTVLGSEYASSLELALTDCGCETAHFDGKMHYRPPGETDWRPLR